MSQITLFKFTIWQPDFIRIFYQLRILGTYATQFFWLDMILVMLYTTIRAIMSITYFVLVKSYNPLIQLKKTLEVRKVYYKCYFPRPILL